jgi:ASC-1-like (ASCH) protein
VTYSLLDSLVQDADPAVVALLEPFTEGTTSSSLHLAVLVEPYLSFILNGSKTVESRFSVNRIPPHGRVQPGDSILLKGAGRPIVGICRAEYVWDYILDTDSWEEIRTRFSTPIRAQDGFWESRRDARFATLIKIADLRRLPATPIGKRDRRGWVVLAAGSKQESLL